MNSSGILVVSPLESAVPKNRGEGVIVANEPALLEVHLINRFWGRSFSSDKKSLEKTGLQPLGNWFFSLQ
jgi:hypothetical protein